MTSVLYIPKNHFWCPILPTNQHIFWPWGMRNGPFSLLSEVNLDGFPVWYPSPVKARVLSIWLHTMDASRSYGWHLDWRVFFFELETTAWNDEEKHTHTHHMEYCIYIYIHTLHTYHFEGVVDFFRFGLFLRGMVSFKTCWICGSSTGGLNTAGRSSYSFTCKYRNQVCYYTIIHTLL